MRNLTILLSVACLALTASCDPREFDDIADSAWVQSDSEGAHNFVGLISAGDGDVEYFAISQTDSFKIKFDQTGKRIAGDGERFTDLAAFTKSPAMAVDSSGYNNTADFGNIAIGGNLATDSSASIVTISGQTGTISGQFKLSGTAAPTGLALGDSNRTGTEVDLVALADGKVQFFEKYATADLAMPNQAECNLSSANTGDLLFAEVATSSDGLELLAAIEGAIQKIEFTAPRANGDCMLTPAISAPGAEASFGAVLAQGNFGGQNDIGGNPQVDLVVSAPKENSVYVFMDWKVGNTSTGIKMSTPGGAKRFGESIAVGDFNGDGIDELVIGDPGHDIAKHKAAGKAYIFESNGSGGFKPAIELHDARAQDEQMFGLSLTATPGYGSDRLIVGTKDEIFTYFRTPLNGDTGFSL